MSDARYVSLDQLSDGHLQTAEVWMQRFGGLVVLAELRGDQVMKVAKWSTETVPGSADGLTRINVGKQKQLFICLSMTNPSLGDTDEQRAGKLDVIQRLSYMDQLLLNLVLERLTDCTLTEEQRSFLREQHSPSEMLQELMGGRTSPDQVVDDAMGTDDGKILLTVALRVPAVLSGELSMSTVRMLHEAIVAERADTVAGMRDAMIEAQVEILKAMNPEV